MTTCNAMTWGEVWMILATAGGLVLTGLVLIAACLLFGKWMMR